MKDRNIVNSYAVKPVVCVDSIDIDSSITVSVSFESNTPPILRSTLNTVDLGCSTDGTSLTESFSTNTDNLIHVVNTGSDGYITLNMCTDTIVSTSDSSKAYFYDEFPISPLSFNSEPAYGSFKSLSSTALQCCEPGSTIPIIGGKVVKVKQNNGFNWDGYSFLHLNEIEIYDTNGQNLALDGSCFSFDIGFGGDPDCLNDGLVGTIQETCNSHSSNTGPDIYDYCVLSDNADIESIQIYPWVDPNRLWMTDRLRNLSVEVFADVSGEGGDAIFTGLLYTYDLIDVFTSQNTDPHEELVPPLQGIIDCPNTTPPIVTLEYQSDFGETYLLFPSTNNATSIEISCELTKCLNNQYMNSDGECVQCPLNHRSDEGSTSVDDCTRCPAGSELLHPQDSSCVLSLDYENIMTAQGWRIWAPEFHVESGWSWDVLELEFYEDADCNGDHIDTSLGNPVDSGNAGNGWGPGNAFGGGTWGGRKDEDDVFYVGLTFNQDITVRCVKHYNANWGDRGVTEVRIQAYFQEDDIWKNAWIEGNLDTSAGGVNTIRIVSTLPPTGEPTQTLTSPPTGTPTQTLTSPPTGTPTQTLTSPPTGTPTQTLTSPPTGTPTQTLTSPPTGTPTQTPTESCSEQPSAVIVGLLSDDNDIFANCGALAANPQYIPTVCSFDPYSIAESLSPAVVCPNTCGNPNATEDPSDPILALLSGTAVQRATCGILADLPSNVINFACNLDLTIWTGYTPSVACCNTCAGF